MMTSRRRRSAFVALFVVAAPRADAQQGHVHNADSSKMIGAADAAMSGPMSAEAKLHMEMSPTRKGTAADTARGREVVRQLKSALAKYSDTTAAVADGFKMFAPNLKNQRVYHFTNYGNAFKEAFRFDAAAPTSLLYRKRQDGRLELIGAMYTAPKRWDSSKLDERVPLSIGVWHKHVNWCVPPLRAQERWTERKNDKPVFGPESPIATREACRAVGGRFLASPMGWMIHANVFLGDDLGVIFAHDH